MAAQVPTQNQAPTRAARSRRGLSATRREARWGYVFISPWLFGFLAFTLIPTVATLVFSFTDMRLSMSGLRFVGLENYRYMLGDSQMWRSLGVTMRYGLYALPVAVFMPLLLALLMNHKHLVGKSIFRAGFYFPYIIPFVAAIFIWAHMLNPAGGWINMFLRNVGVSSPPEWLRSPT